MIYIIWLLLLANLSINLLYVLWLVIHRNDAETIAYKKNREEIKGLLKGEKRMAVTITEGYEIKIKYFTDIEPLEKINKGDWIDLRAAEDVEMKAGEFKLIPLGVGMILPEGFEANIVPRSSTFKNFGILQTNSFGVIDNSYSGDNDQWKFPTLAMRDTVIHKNDRICQFRINKIQPNIIFETVDKLNDTDRNGFGSTGK